MQKLLTNKTVSLTDLRNPKKLIESAGNSVVAILNRNKLVGYFVPKTAPGVHEYTYANPALVATTVKELKRNEAHVLEYLKDK